jgi:hypothetical protein
MRCSEYAGPSTTHPTNPLTVPSPLPLIPPLPQQFRTRAAKVEQGLKGIAKVVIHAEKPNKGAFVITIGSKKVVNLTGLKRPFPKLKALDMDDVIEDCKSKL